MDPILKTYISHQLMSDSSIYIFGQPIYIEMDQSVNVVQMTYSGKLTEAQKMYLPVIL